MTTAFAYIADGQLFLNNGKKTREIQTEFGRKIVERDAAIRERNAWKARGKGSRFMNPWAEQDIDPQFEVPVYVTGVSADVAVGDILCSIETSGVCALLRLSTGEDPGEQRLKHTTDLFLRDITRHPAADRLACSLSTGGISNIAVAKADGSALGEITEGDSMDEAPSWIPGSTDELVFQSAGVARSADGFPAGVGAFRIEKLNVENGEHEVLAEQDGFDLLAPKVDAEGRLHFIRRPYQSRFARPWWQTALDVVLLPYRLLQLFFGFLNLISGFCTGKPLIELGDARSRKVDAREWFLWGRMIDAEKAMRANKGADAPNLVPDDWQLIRKEPNGDETTLARAVAAYDLLLGGEFLYTNGSAVFRCTADGAKQVMAREKLIRQVVALRATV